ncbi:hypothetical protein [Neolewinella persica]|uniref:hypothetical protein n=1 Tax=Neolewinella persica TaxID=70998 RepID=UPI000367E1E2|nr:hypothetical protein [Neolewinella persica]
MPSTELNEYPLLAYKAYKHKKLAALDGILTVWEDASARFGRGQFYTFALHMRHIYFGLMALDNNDVPTAKMELIKASKIPGSLIMGSFGPNMLLAHRLLQRGEKKIVLKFLKNCRSFWHLPSRIYFARTWRSAILRGETPDFGEHLYMYMGWEKGFEPDLLSA